MTSKVLERIRVPYSIVIEPQEYEQYAAVIDPQKILVLPFSNLGQGSIPARNWVWEHSIAIGATWHWILDDNISCLYWKDGNNYHRIASGTIFHIMEDFVGRYQNIAIAGPHDHMFAPKKARLPNPFTLNSRVYSCILIRNDIPFRWRGKYNEDTDLSLRALKAGWCTVLFTAFLMDKATTMSVPGGNTESLYKLADGTDGRLLMAQSLQAQHPDVVKITRKWGRWQHQVDYRPFKRNRLIKKKGIVIPEGVNNYGMKLVKVGESS